MARRVSGPTRIGTVIVRLPHYWVSIIPDPSHAFHWEAWVKTGDEKPTTLGDGHGLFVSQTPAQVQALLDQLEQG